MIVTVFIGYSIGGHYRFPFVKDVAPYCSTKRSVTNITENLRELMLIERLPIRITVTSVLNFFFCFPDFFFIKLTRFVYFGFRAPSVTHTYHEDDYLIFYGLHIDIFVMVQHRWLWYFVFLQSSFRDAKKSANRLLDDTFLRVVLWEFNVSKYESVKEFHRTHFLLTLGTRTV